jgi:hypothetical protein
MQGKAYLTRGDENLSTKYLSEAIRLFRESKYPLREAACYEMLGMFSKAAGERCSGSWYNIYTSIF